MNRLDGNGVGVMKALRLSAAGTAYLGSFDTKGYDRANVYLMAYNGASAAASGFVSSIIMSESDTITSASSQTDIVALTGGTATSTSVGFVIGGDTANTGATGCIELQIDLKKRKRYLGLYIACDQGESCVASGIAIFGRAEQSADTAAAKKVSNLENTVATINTVVTV